VRRKESGHTLLYTIVFMPLLLGAGALAFDLSGLNSKTESAQSLLDSIALDVTQLLPDIDEVKREAAAKLHLQNDIFQVSKVEVSAQHSSVKIIATLKPSSMLLPVILTSLNISTTPRAEVIVSEAELHPVDSVVILSDGVDQRPWKLNGVEDAWAESRGIGEASSAFSSCITPPVARFSNVDTSFLWTSESGRRWLTQSCFNPVFTNIKLGAMNLTDSLLRLETNRSAVVFTPGITGTGQAIRHVRGEHFNELSGETILEGTIGGFPKGKVIRGEWEPAYDYEYELGDDACIVFSDSEIAWKSEYAIANFRRTKSSPSGCSAPILNRSCQLPFKVDEDSRVDRECLRGASLAEAIYWRSAKRPKVNSEALPNFYSALNLSLNELYSERSLKEKELEKATRGNLSENPLRLLFILTSYLPELERENSELKAISSSGTSLIIGYIRRNNYPSAAIDPAVQERRIAQWKEYLNEQTPQFTKSQLEEAQTPEELNSKLIPGFISKAKRIVLRR